MIIEEKGIFLIGGKNNEIRIYRNDNYEYIKIIKNLNNGIIASFMNKQSKFGHLFLNNLFR